MTETFSKTWQMRGRSLFTEELRRWIQTYPELVAALLCAVLTLLGWVALNGNWLGLGIWILLAAYVIGGYESTREGLTTLWQEQELDVDLLMIVAALGAATLGLWQREYYLLVDGAVLILIFAISGALESVAMHRTERNIRGLMQLAPDTARVMRDGQEEMVATERLQVGDHVLVKPGELIPADGVVKEGASTINQAPITGESVPVEKALGDEAFAGTINGSGALVLELHKPPESSLIQRVIRLVEEAQTTQPRSQQFLERFERGYARVIVVSALLLVFLPPLLLGWGWETTIYRALVFLVVASPCALMAAIMPTLLSGIASGARQGILFKDGAQLETIGQLGAILHGRGCAIAFDKTGTLTTGNLQVCDLVPANGIEADRVLQAAASLEAYSEHPIAQAVVRAAQKRAIPLLPLASVQAQAGQGISGTLSGDTLKLGKRSFITTDLSAYAQLAHTSQQLETEGKTVIWVSRQGQMEGQMEGQILGLLAVANRVRPESSHLLNGLKRMGIKTTVMLTGDNAATAQSVAQAVGVDRVYADLLPEDKVEVVKQLQQQYHTVAMVGDGINDAPALAQASVGIAMGGTGSDMALETADIVLMADRLEKLEQAIHLGVKSQRIIKQNMTLALSSVAFLMVANFLGDLTLPAGVLGHEGSTLLVTLNGLRMLRSDQNSPI